MDIAKKIIRFRLSHFPALLAVATEEGLLEDSQCRRVEAFDVFYDAKEYKEAKAKLAIYQRDLPAESAEYKTYEGPDEMRVSHFILCRRQFIPTSAFQKLQLSPEAVGCLSTYAGAAHPYRLVTGILSRLLKSYPKR